MVSRFKLKAVIQSCAKCMPSYDGCIYAFSQMDDAAQFLVVSLTSMECTWSMEWLRSVCSAYGTCSICICGSKCIICVRVSLWWQLCICMCLYFVSLVCVSVAICVYVFGISSMCICACVYTFYISSIYVYVVVNSS